LLSGAFLLASAAYASAADLPVKAPAYKVAAPYSWSGFYGGISGGYGFGSNDVFDSYNIATVSHHYDPRGGFGGVQFGYNNQFAPHWLIGSEFDLSFGDVHDDFTILGGGNVTSTKDKFDWFGTARTRFGYVQDKTLIYATGGAIWVHEKFSAPITSLGGNDVHEDISQYHVSWVVGGGIEYAIDPRWSFKLEYLYAPFDGTHDSLGGMSTSSDPAFQVVRAGLNYRFADNGAPASYMPTKATMPRSDWNGSYLGVHGGYGWSKAGYDLADNFPGTPIVAHGSADPDGGFGGFQGGYNWVFAPQWLAGAEVDSSFGDLNGGGFFNATNGGVPFVTHSPVTAKIEDLGTARLRLGYLVTPDVLVYGTGGAAYARAQLSDGAGDNSKFDHLGWIAGGGIEWKFAPTWSAKLEYDYADLGAVSIDGPNGSFAGGITIADRSYDLTLQTIKVGLNYSGPVIERFFGEH
jgi:outer membrane immunogenic protein